MATIRALAAALTAVMVFGCAGGARRDGGVVYLGQGWSHEDRRFFYHTSQGTRLMPFAWFLALTERDSPRRFAASDYATRYGFIPDRDPEGNPHLLPVGMASDVDPATHRAYLGFTCAACHTTQITYRGAAVRVDGGQGTIDVVGLSDALFDLLARTEASPTRFDAFARAVLEDQDDEATRRLLRAEVRDALDSLAKQVFTASQGLHATVAGFGRLDALGRAGNLLFGELGAANLRATNAPVSYPALWGSSCYDWVQWNGLVGQPMGRNIAEALGVGAPVALLDGPTFRARTSVRVDNLVRFERQIERLRPPRWPAQLFGSIDVAKAARGKELYATLCASCHDPVLKPPNEYGKRFFVAKMVPLDVIGTDALDALNFHERTFDTGSLGLGTISAAQGFDLFTTAIRRTKYDEYGLAADQRIAWDGYRRNDWRAPLAYRARDLSGIWATAPYLHNGSIPNLYELLVPASRRSRRFYLGQAEFDPRYVGLETAYSPGRFELDTEAPGNSNAGHEFRDGPRQGGVLGPELTDQERWALLEYLKTL